MTSRPYLALVAGIAFSIAFTACSRRSAHQGMAEGKAQVAAANLFAPTAGGQAGGASSAADPAASGPATPAAGNAAGAGTAACNPELCPSPKPSPSPTPAPSTSPNPYVPPSAPVVKVCNTHDSAPSVTAATEGLRVEVYKTGVTYIWPNYTNSLVTLGSKVFSSTDPLRVRDLVMDEGRIDLRGVPTEAGAKYLIAVSNLSTPEGVRPLASNAGLANNGYISPLEPWAGAEILHLAAFGTLDSLQTLSAIDSGPDASGVRGYSMQPPPWMQVTVKPGVPLYYGSLDSGNSVLQACDAQVDPLILNLAAPAARASITLSPPSQGVWFNIQDETDLTSGQAILRPISWPIDAADNRFLVLPDEDGAVASVRQLFGNYTVDPETGNTTENGFLALARYDANGDGIIDARDPIYTRLRLWADRNRDGIVQPRELAGLAETGIAAIDVQSDTVNEIDRYGNRTEQRSVYRTFNGTYGAIFDVWFRVDLAREKLR